MHGGAIALESAPYAFTPRNYERLVRIERQVASRAPHYLFTYLSGLGANAILVERPYVDRETGEDCTRLHIFRYDAKKLKQELIGGLFPFPPADCASGTLASPDHWGYLGYIVVRPDADRRLPSIGRTIVLKDVKVPGPGLGYRDCCSHECVANLCGVEFRLRSLAFQEQCGRYASCASVALWGAFQVSQNHYGTPRAPSPREITLAAKGYAPNDFDVFNLRLRSPGALHLTTDEMLRAIERFDYQHQAEAITEKVPWRTLVYSYLKFGFPIVLNLHNGAPTLDEIRTDRYDMHAVLLTDFETTKAVRDEAATGELEEALLVADRSENEMRLKGRRITRLYAHDDQVGPFCTMEVQAAPRVYKRFPHPVALTGSWEAAQAPSYQPKHFLDQHLNVAIPVVSDRIRVSFMDVYGWVRMAHQAFGGLMLAPGLRLPTGVPRTQQYREWDIYLVRAKEYKQELARERLKQESRLDESAYRSLLVQCYPMYLWRATFRINRLCVFELLFDAEHDEPAACPTIRARWFDADVGAFVHRYLLNPKSGVAEQLHGRFRGFEEERKHILSRAREALVRRHVQVHLRNLAICAEGRVSANVIHETMRPYAEKVAWQHVKRELDARLFSDSLLTGFATVIEDSFAQVAARRVGAN